MKSSLKLHCLIAATIALAPVASAATIAFSGSQLDLGPGWRTPSVAKTQDADGDNIYGTDGYVMFQTGFVPDPPPADQFRFNSNPFSDASTAFPSYATVTADGATGSVTAANFSDINNPNNPSNDFNSGVASRSNFTALGSEQSLMNINFIAANFPTAGVRVGVFVNNAADRNPMAVRLTLDGGGTVSATAATGMDVSSQNDYYFFDITDITANATFSFFATEDTGDGNTAGEVRVGGFTFDTIPEPGALSLLALSGGLLLFRRRR